jgi:hypothetical protein
MTNALGFDALKGILPRRIKHLPDHRKPGPHTRYTIQDAALGAFGVFYTQSPSFLEYQRHLQQAKGQNNACTLFGGEQIPCNNQVRTLLDPLMPRHLKGVYLEVFEGLEQHGMLSNFRGLDHPLLGALDGTPYHSSHAMHCPHGLRRQTAQGRTLYSQSALTPVIVCPGHSDVIALPPEFIMPPDGPDKQDCERAGGKRWMEQYAKQVAPHGVPLLGDDLSSNQPLCKWALHHGFNCIFVCKPASHTTLYERLTLWQATHAIREVARRHRRGRVTEVLLDRYSNEVLLRGGKGALSVNWFEITSVHATTGEQLYHHSFITHHSITDDNVADLAHAGRGRWKIENDHNNVRKTQGYHSEHNFGHGQQYLAAFLLSLNLLALLFHTVLEWCDDKYALVRQVLARRQTFFDDIRALTRYRVFEGWQHLRDFMIRGLELEARLETMLETTIDTG